MDSRRRNTKITLHVRFCRWVAVDFGVVVDEGQILTLLVSVVQHSLISAVWCPISRGLDGKSYLILSVGPRCYIGRPTDWLSGSGKGKRNAFVIIAQLGKMHSVPAAAEPLSAGAGVGRLYSFYCFLLPSALRLPNTFARVISSLSKRLQLLQQNLFQ